MATRQYDVVILEKVATHYRVQASSGQEASFLVGKVDGNDRPDGVELVSSKVVGTKVSTNPTLTDDSQLLLGQVEVQDPTENLMALGQEVAEQLAGAEDVNSGETDVASPPQRRQAR